MKIKKITLLFTFLILFTFTFNCSADTLSYKKNSHLYNEQEYQKAVNALKSESFISDYNNPEKDVVFASRFYYIHKNPYDSLKQGKLLDQCMEKESYWIFMTKDAQSAIVQQKEGYYSIVEVRNPTEDLDQWRIDFSKVEIAVDSLGAELSDDNLIIKFISMEYFGIDRLFYIRYNNQEFFIPFSNIPSVTRFENGKIYKIEDLVTHLERKNSEEKKQISLLTHPKVQKQLYFTLAIASAFAILTLAFWVFVLKRKNI